MKPSLKSFLGVYALIGLVNITAARGPNEEVSKMEKAFVAKDFSNLIGTPGFSDTLLTNHFKLYQGYVANTNTLLEKMAGLIGEGREKTPEFAEMKRRFGWEFNGMRLHEYFFANLGGKSLLTATDPLHDKLAKVFGSVENWQRDFKAAASMRGIGWVILYQDTLTGHLFNTWINEHDVGHPAGANPLLVMDVFEHAFITDYQLDRARYIEAFFAAINWAEVGKRVK